jgi:subtilisin family serine protease
MKRLCLFLAALIAFSLAQAPTVAAQGQQQQRYIVRTTKGLSSILSFCSSAGCQVHGALDGSIGQTYLVTSSNPNFLVNVISGVLRLVEQILGITSVEADQLLSVRAPKKTSANIPPGLKDTAPVNYFGSIVWHGYAEQPAAQIIRLTDAQNGFRVNGSGVSGSGVIVAVIDTGVDTSHPALVGVLLPGYDFTRNQPGASEWLDVNGLPNGPVGSNSEDQQPAFVQQSTAAVLDQSTAAVLDGTPYAAFGHGTMTSGLVHLVAPKAQILPLKAFSSDGTGYLSNIVAALYYAVQHKANVVNMSFDLSTSSPALSDAISRANEANVVLVAAAGNENTSAPVYPAAYDGSVAGIASTTDWDTRSSFSNYGPTDVWIAAPGENVISTFPGGTYGSSSGTSFSSPMVAGTAALMLSASPNMNQTKASTALEHGRKLTPDLNHGRLDVYQVLAYLQTIGAIR